MGITDENGYFELDVAMKSTGGDSEKANAMVAGEYFDCAVLKGSFLMKDTMQSGLILIFFNTANDYIPFIDSVILKTSVIYEQIDIASDWKIIWRELGALKKSIDIVNIPEINDKIINEILKANFFPDVKSGNLNQLENDMRVILRKVWGNQQVSCNLSIEQVSSLTMSKEGIPFEKPSSLEQTHADSEIESIMQNIEKQAEFVLEGSAVIAPVKGKFITNIQIDDEILILLTDKDQMSKNILTTRQAIDEDGIISPVPGKVVQKISLPETGTIVLYALIDKGILVKLVEDSSLKIIDTSVGKTSAGEMTIPLGIVLFIIIAVIGVLIFLLV